VNQLPDPSDGDHVPRFAVDQPQMDAATRQAPQAATSRPAPYGSAPAVGRRPDERRRLFVLILALVLVALVVVALLVAYL
jgi:hypothetical protein